MSSLSHKTAILSSKWRRLVRRLPAWGGMALVWAASILTLVRPGAAVWLFPIFFLSALILAWPRPALRRLFCAALLFFLAWSAFRVLLDLAFRHEEEFSLMALGCWVFSGLHLFSAWTPLEVSWAVRRLLQVFLGRRRAALAAVSLVTLMKALPWIVSDALELKRTLAQRAPELPFKRRVALWGQALLRLTFKRADDLSLALVQRQDAVTGSAKLSSE